MYRFSQSGVHALGVVACACNPAKMWKLQTDSAEDAGSKLSHVFRMVTLKVGPQT